MPRGSGLQAAAAAVVAARKGDDLIEWGAALDRLEVAVEAEREKGARRVARMRARRKEQTDAHHAG